MRILVTGENGYISQSFRSYMRQFSDRYQVDALSVRGEVWRSWDISSYDAVIHTAGLVHRRETAYNRMQYFQINRDLTAEVGRKARDAGVRQFVFLSSMSVYGIVEGTIGPSTAPDPKSSYGRSKLEGERLLRELETEDFRVAVLRPPMVYGPGCKGNYRTLERLARSLPVCPDYSNRRSMIEIDRLCVFLKELVDSGGGGTFCPQDPEYICTCSLIGQLAKAQGKELAMCKSLNFVPAFLRRFTKVGRKAFGDLMYCGESKCSDASV